ncbi:receptor-like protein 35 [Solanum stenotomum]|uniref:receptor-like protein 35 n=1 Tax=Solanum stenotomum TaxID=172797 RepID=UPI0020D180ED|nr:receptor-like protein 35 [Solanum stenotomum]
MEPYENFSYTSYENSVRLVIKGHDTELERISTIMTTIDLSSNHFEGVISKSLKNLSSLWLLNLSRNNLIGHIPMELGQLNMLEALDLSWNRLTGKIPRELTRMNFLAVLNLSQSHLVGPIPHGPQFNTFENDSYGCNLDLCGHPLSKQCGTSDSSHVPQPLESEEDEGDSYFFSGFTCCLVRRSSALHEAAMVAGRSGHFSEALSLLQLKQHFEISDKYSRHYSTSLPKASSWNESTDCCTWDWITCDMLTGYVIGLDLSNANISGTIHPNSSLFQLHRLQMLNLAYNNLSGLIPDSIDNITQIRELNFGYNHFTGNIPSTISKLKHLTSLDLSFNSLGDLSSNSLSGPLPNNVSMLLKLVDLDFSHNLLNGTIPSWVFSLPSLYMLELYSMDYPMSSE